MLTNVSSMETMIGVRIPQNLKAKFAKLAGKTGIKESDLARAAFYHFTKNFNSADKVMSAVFESFNGLRDSNESKPKKARAGKTLAAKCA